MLPTNRTYGDWPRSGEIDLIESRGNRQYLNNKGKHIGVEHFGSTLHFGPRWDQNGYWSATFETHSKPKEGFNNGFHRFLIVWTPECITFCVDGREIGQIKAGDGFWKRAKFTGDDIWANATKMAPFDQEVSKIYIIFFLNWHIRCEMFCHSAQSVSYRKKVRKHSVTYVHFCQTTNFFVQNF